MQMIIRERERLSLKISTGTIPSQNAGFTERFYCVRPSACVRARSRACVRERNTEKFGLSSSLPLSFHLLSCFALFHPLFLPLASCSPEAKEARVLLRLTFSGMNYLARQVPVLASRYCDFAIRRRNTRWEYALGADERNCRIIQL